MSYKKLSLFVFIDALGWQVYQRHGFMQNHTSASRPLKTVFGFSSAADPSILTGRYPEEHTHWSAFYYSPQTSPFKLLKLFSFLPRKIFDRWRIRHWLSKLLAKAYGFTGYFEIYSVPFEVLPYFDYQEKRDYFVPGGIIKGDTIFDWLSKRQIPYHCSNWRQSETENIAALKAEICTGEIEFAYLYLPTLDGLMHHVGTQNPQVKAKLNWYEEQLESILALAEERYDEVAFYSFSDHGMTDVTGSVDLISQLESTGLVFGQDYVAMYDSTMARFWFLTPQARPLIEACLKTVPQGKIVSEEEVKRMRCYFPDHQFGELFFLMEPGILINPSFMGLKLIPGMHGYHPDDPDSYSYLISNRQLPPQIQSITDLRGLMEYEVNHPGQALLEVA